MQKKSLLSFSLLMLGFFCFSQNLTINDSINEIKYPYKLPIWGQKVVDKGYGDRLQLPYGLNVNYINVFMEMEISQFELDIGGRDLTNIINTETLNFTDVSATSNGVNVRGDFWLFPFMNVYGMFSKVTGGTNVSLQPTWRNEFNEIILQLPEFGTSVDFDAIAYGAGTTLAFGYENFFLSTDINYSATNTALLEDQIGILCLSARLGRRFNLSKKKPDINIAPYVGVMNRDFVGSKGSKGSIDFAEVFPDLDETFNNSVANKIQENNDEIDSLNPILNASEIIELRAKNVALEKIQTAVNDSGIFTTSINYFIKKEMIQSYTFQFGFNFQLSKHIMLRGEYGISDSQRFLMSGIQYRFGF